jgi:hypothetical protein
VARPTKFFSLTWPVKDLAQCVWLMFHSFSWLSVEADTMSVLFKNFT